MKNNRQYISSEHPVVPLDGPEYVALDYVTGAYEAIALDDISQASTDDVDSEGADVRDTLHHRQPILDPNRYPTQNTRQGKIILRRKPKPAGNQRPATRPAPPTRSYNPETTAPSMFWLRVKVAFYVFLVCAAFLIWLTFAVILPGVGWAKNHWEYGASYPTTYPIIAVNGSKYFVQSAYLPTDQPGQGQVSLNLIAKDPRQKSQAFTIPIVGYGDYHVVTVKREKDNTGKDDIQSYIDGVAGPRLINHGKGLVAEN